jgi:hypothetical protein
VRYAQLLRRAARVDDARARELQGIAGTRAHGAAHYRKMQQQVAVRAREREAALSALMRAAGARPRLLLGDAMDIAAAEQNLARRDADDAPARKNPAQRRRAAASVRGSSSGRITAPLAR